MHARTPPCMCMLYLCVMTRWLTSPVPCGSPPGYFKGQQKTIFLFLTLCTHRYNCDNSMCIGTRTCLSDPKLKACACPAPRRTYCAVCVHVCGRANVHGLITHWILLPTFEIYLHLHIIYGNTYPGFYGQYTGLICAANGMRYNVAKVR